jgi:DNA repair protein RadC
LTFSKTVAFSAAPDRMGRQTPSDWAFVKIENVESLPAREAQFHSLQLELPLDPAVAADIHSTGFEAVHHRSQHDVLADYLTTIGVVNANDIARALLGEFGSLSDLLGASWWRLKGAVGGRLAGVIRATRAIMHVALSEPLSERPILPGSAHLAEFLRNQLGFLPRERLLAIYVDSQLRLIRIQKIADGSVIGVNGSLTQIIQWGLNVGAAGLLLVHNHPSGIPEPSNADIAFTDRLREIAKHLDMFLLDHLIITRDRVGSLGDFWREARWTKRTE